MDHRKPSILPSELGLRPASERTSAAVDAPRAALATSALNAMGGAQVEEPPEPAMPLVRGARP